MAQLTSVHVLRIDLRGAKPPIWRRVAVPSDITLAQLHSVIQGVMGWEDDHLHAFRLEEATQKNWRVEPEQLARQGRWDEFETALRGERTFSPRRSPYGDPINLEGEDEASVTLGAICPKPTGKGNAKTKLIYHYDFGDDWRHLIKVEKVEPPEPNVAYPVCLAGRRACPPEDCGGIYSYQMMLAARAEGRDDGGDYLNEWVADDFDADAFDIERVNERLAELRNRGKQRRRKGSASR